MKRRLHAWLVLGLVGVGFTETTTVRADEAACIAASESEVGLRRQLKLQESLKQLVIRASPACPGVIRAECSRRLAEVNTAMPTVVLGATDAAGNDSAAVTVTLDGAPLASTLDGRPVTIDPGSHTLRFESAGKPPVDKTVVIAAGVKDRHVTVVMGAAAVAVAPAAAPAPPTAEPGTGVGMRTAAYVTGGVGVAGVVVGSIVGGMAISQSSRAKNECAPAGTGCAGNTDPAAATDMNGARTLATTSTVSFVAGGALVAAGVTMFVLSRPKRPTTGLRWTPSVMARGGGGLTLSGGW